MLPHKQKAENSINAAQHSILGFPLAQTSREEVGDANALAESGYYKSTTDTCKAGELMLLELWQ